jgi:hypothetical protein
MAYVWTNSIGKTEEAVNLLKAGIEGNPMRSVSRLGQGLLSTCSQIFNPKLSPEFCMRGGIGAPRKLRGSAQGL